MGYFNNPAAFEPIIHDSPPFRVGLLEFRCHPPPPPLLVVPPIPDRFTPSVPPGRSLLYPTDSAPVPLQDGPSDSHLFQGLYSERITAYVYLSLKEKLIIYKDT